MTSHTKLERVDCKRGAPMGRANYFEPKFSPVTVKLSRVLLDSGAYDPGGAYWGFPNDLYWCRDYHDTVQLFVRAPSRYVAWSELKKDYPSLCLARSMK